MNLRGSGWLPVMNTNIEKEEKRISGISYKALIGEMLDKGDTMSAKVGQLRYVLRAYMITKDIEEKSNLTSIYNRCIFVERIKKEMKRRWGIWKEC